MDSGKHHKLNIRANFPRNLSESPFPPILLPLVVASFALLLTWPCFPCGGADSGMYIELANGRPHNVTSPFSGRILYPITARITSGIFNLSIDQAFFVVGMLSFVALVILVSQIVSSTTNHPLVVVPVLFTPFLLQLVPTCYNPDIFHAALLGLFLITLLRDNLWPLSVCLLLPLYLTRESTILLSTVLVFLGIQRSHWKLVGSVVAVTGVGIFLTSLAARLGQPNIHHLHAFPYMFLKVVYNFLLNIVGIEVWVNTITTLEPVAETEVPSWLQLGAINRIGFSSWSPMRPARTFCTLLTVFGVAPVILGFDVLKNWKKMLENRPLWLCTATIYGLVAFLMGTTIGACTGRLIGYAWPAFWLAAPAVAAKHYCLDRGISIRLVLLHVIACWIPLAWDLVPSKSLPFLLLIIFVAGILHYLAFLQIRSAYARTGIVGS